MEHVILCFIEDDFGVRHAREIGIDRICIETDYPHSDAIVAERARAHAWTSSRRPTSPTHEINQMTHLNAMRSSSYDPFTHIPRERATVGALRAEAIGVDTTPVARGRRFAPREHIKIVDVNATA